MGFQNFAYRFSIVMFQTAPLLLSFMSLEMPVNRHSAQWLFSVSVMPVEQRNVHLLQPTRVAPKKPLRIPKLELRAAVLSARLSLVVIKEHG